MASLKKLFRKKDKGSKSSKMSPDKAWYNDYLEAHNRYRALHQVAPVKFNDNLNKLAQKWADKLASTDSFQHSDCKFEGGRIGENIAMKMSSSQSDFAGHEFVDQWYSEVERYDFPKHGGPSTGHFTQVVWKASKEIGVGKAKTKSGKTIVVGQYLPAGNMMGENAQNVFPTKDGKITLPKKESPKPMPVSGGGSTGGSGAPAGVENYKSVKKSTKSKSLPDGRMEIVTTEVYTMQDGSTKTVEKREVK